MFKKPTKKQFLIRRVLLSILATVSVLIIVTASILFMLGYRLDSDNGRLEQGALLQFNSTPDAAQVWIDGTYIGSQTSTKQTIVAGQHSIRMVKEGYEDWNRTLNLEAGTLTWLDYARLVPRDRPVQRVMPFETLVSLQFSPDLKWGLAHRAANSPTFDFIDLRSEQVKSTQITIAPTLYAEGTVAGAAHQFSVSKWSSGGRYAIVKHVYGDNRTEWLMVDTQDVARSVNITTSLNVDLAEVQFASNSGMGLFGLTTDGVLRKLDLSGGTISRGLVTHVKTFTVFEENSVVGYTGADPADATKTVVGTYRDGDSASRILRSSTDAQISYRIDVGRYFGDDYVAIAENNKVTILVGSVPGTSTQENTLRKFAELELGQIVTQLSFSPRSSYVLAQAGSGFMSYELEHKRSATGSFTVAEGKTPSALKWLSSSQLWNDDGDTVTMRDFDGTNVYGIMPSVAGFDATLSQNGRFFYSVGQNADGGLQLQRVRMILN